MGLDLSRLFRLDPSKPLGGRYHIVEQLGAGGFSQTFLAEDLHLPGRPRCVVKQLKPQTQDTTILQTARRLFDTEAQVLYQLGKHDQIPHLLAHFEENREFYLVQELVEGHPLTQELVDGQPWSQEQVLVLLHHVLTVLAFVHQQQVIHRDIKPSNLMRRHRDGKMVLIDFGAVKQTTSQLANPDTGPTVTISIGTQGYMPNEQMAGKPRYSSDVYAIGVIGIQALTGIHPREFGSDPNTGELDWHDQVQDVSPEVIALLDRMVHYHFKDRYQTAQDALQALDTLLSSDPNLAASVETASSSNSFTSEVTTLNTAVDETHLTEANAALTLPSASPTVVSPGAASPGSSIPQLPKRSALWTALGIGSVLAIVATVLLAPLTKPVSQSVAVSSLLQSLPCRDLEASPLPPGEPDYKYPNGIRYYGALKNGLPADGTVTIVFPSGNRYQGNLKSGKRNGCGILTFANGREYVGEFQNDRFSGQGVWTLENGDRYIGDFKDNKCHGQGTFIFVNGTSKHGVWQDGILTGENLSCDR